MLIGNLCDYSIQEYETLKPQVEALFPVGLTVKEARAMLSRIGVKEIKQVPIYERDKDQYVFKDEQPVLLKSQMLLGIVNCQLPDQNMNWWRIETFVDEEGRVGEAGFYVFIGDENFAKRDIPLKASYIIGSSILRKAIRSLFLARFPDWNLLQKHLLDGGFEVYEEKQWSTPSTKRFVVKNITGYTKILSIRKTARRLPGKTVRQIAGVVVDSSGKVLKIPD